MSFIDREIMESRMVPCIIIIISYIKHQNNNIAKFSPDMTLLFYHNNNYVSFEKILLLMKLIFFLLKNVTQKRFFL